MKMNTMCIHTVAVNTTATPQITQPHAHFDPRNQTLDYFEPRYHHWTLENQYGDLNYAVMSWILTLHARNMDPSSHRLSGISRQGTIIKTGILVTTNRNLCYGTYTHGKSRRIDNDGKSSSLKSYNSLYPF